MRNRATVKIKSPEKRARIGERIKIAATSSGMTLKELAERVDTAPGLIYQYVRGITNVPVDTLKAIAAVTKVSLEFFDPEKDTRSAFALPAESAEEAEHVPNKEKVAADLRHLQQLADAYDEPKRNVSSLTAVLHEMLAIARVTGDRRQEAYVLWRLGVVHNENNEYDEARQYLIQARDMFAEQGLEEYRIAAMIDLAFTSAETGNLDAAIQYSREAVAVGSKDVRWRALINIGGFQYRQRNYDEAFKAFSEAAVALEDIDDHQRESEGMPYLMSRIAEIAKDTGHYEAAMSLWGKSLAQATQEKRADVFLEGLLNVAQCCQVMGRLSEARQRLEQAVVLASFMFDDQQRLGVARARLADVMVALGLLDEAKENARAALRIATRVGGQRGMIISSLALAETYMATGQLDDAISYADDAIHEAQRARRMQEAAQARNTRARICLALARQDDSGAWLREAKAEAERALSVAERADASREKIIAHLTLAHCELSQDNASGAEQATEAAINLVESGAVGLQRLVGEEVELPFLLKAPPIELEKLFASRALQLPALEWEAHYVQGIARAKRLGPEAAFVAMRDAAKALGLLLSGLTPQDADHFREQNPEIENLFKDLARFALTEADREEARMLLENAARLGLAGSLTTQALPAAPGK